MCTNIFHIVGECGWNSRELVGPDGGFLESPNFPDNYNNSHDCEVELEASDAGRFIRFEVVEFNTEYGYDYVDVSCLRTHMKNVVLQQKSKTDSFSDH